MLTIFTGIDQEEKLYQMAALADQAAAADCDSLRQNLLWLTPDQFTFETERDLMHRLQQQTRCRMVVTGFLRFSDRILKQFGGAAVRHADNLCKLILMRRALADCKDQLQTYGSMSRMEDLQFEEELLAFVRQLKFEGITPEQLLKFGTQKEISENLRAKASDLGQIALHYEARLGSAWRDSLDDISAAVQKLFEQEKQGQRYFAGMTVFFDGFKSFTAPQYDMIRLMLRQGAAVYVSLQLDRKQAQKELHSIFAVTLDTYDRLFALAGGHCAERTFAPEMPQNALDAVKQGLFVDPVSPFAADESVQVYSCRDEYAEVEFCFGKLKSMVKDSDLRWRDIAVVYRNASDYLLPIAAAAQKFEVPYCVDGGEQPQNQGLFSVCTALLRSAYQRFDPTDMLCIAKSGLFPADAVELAELSAYLEVWQPRSLDDWKRPFTAKLSGYETVEFGEETPLGDAPELLRQKLMGLLEPLLGTSSATGREYGALLYDTLEKSGILSQFALDTANEPELERQMQLKRVWNSFGDILTRLSDMLAEEKISGSTYYRLFLQSVKETKIKAVVQTMDCVMIGSADAVRLHQPKVLWILGANDGIFPKRPSGKNGLFSESEYQQFSEMKFTVGKTLEERIAEERFSAYQMIAAPTKQLFVSFRAADLGDTKQLPGEIVWRLEVMLSIQPQKGILSEREWMTTPQAAFDAYCRFARTDPENASKFRDLLTKLPGTPYQSMLDTVEQLLHPKRYLLSDQATIESLYMLYERMLSPSEIEQYFACPFAYYIKYGLKLRVKERAAYNPLLRGNIVHRVIAVLTRQLSEQAKADAAEAANNGKTAAPEQIKAKIGKMVRDAFDDELQRVFENPGRICTRDKALAEGILLRITRIAENIYAEQLQSEFQVFAVECDVGNQQIAPLSIPVEAQKSVRIRGRIDRLDIWRDELSKKKQTFFRIIDYKTGDKKFSYAKLMSGEHLQMLLYEMAVESGGKGGFADLVPAGVLYYPAKEMAYLADPYANEQEKGEHFASNYCMNGILVDEQESLARVRAMEKDLKQHYVPVGLNWRNSMDYSSLRSDAEYRKLKQYVSHQVRKMAKEVSSGGIRPAFLTDDTNCRYCKFSALCGNDIRIESANGEKYSEQEAKDMILEQEESKWD